MEPWVTPTITATTALIKNREQITKAWDQILAKTLGKGFNVAVVGEAGVGKTVLVDHLVGDAFKANYRPPGQSPRVDRDSRRLNGHRYKFAVVPGQPIHRDRIRDLDEVLVSGKPQIDGVLYVVANGYHTLRTTTASEIAAQMSAGDIRKLRSARLEAELADFKSTLSILRQSIYKYRQPSWLILVSNKADLYSRQDSLTAAQTQYLGENSGFAVAMNEFLGQVGSDNFTWTSVPVCTWLEPYTVGSSESPSAMTIPQRNAMLHSFFEVMERICQGTT